MHSVGRFLFSVDRMVLFSLSTIMFHNYITQKGPNAFQAFRRPFLCRHCIYGMVHSMVVVNTFMQYVVVLFHEPTF